LKRIHQILASFAAIALLAAIGTGQAPQKPGFQVVSTHDEPTIAGRAVALDASKKLLPFPSPDDTGYSYSAYFLSQWTITWDQYNRQRLPYYYCCFDFDRTTYEMKPDEHWANSTGYLRAMMQGFIERLYAYTGDPRTVEFLTNFADYELANGLTPKDYLWSEVPYPSANPGSAKYTGWSNHGEDYIEPHVVGEDGYAYLRLYEMTGNTKYLVEAIHCADALVKNFKPGDAKNSPWPGRIHGRDGSLKNGSGMFPYSANVVEPIMLFDELMRLNQGNVVSYRKIRAGAWAWLMKYPMQNNVWVGYFEDVPGDMKNMNQVIPLEFARYVLLHPEKDPQWRKHSRDLIEWVKTTPKWPKWIVHGATVTTEQGDGKQFCCNEPNQCCDSHSARLAAVEALYYWKTGDVSYKEAAYRTYNWVSYWQGLAGGAHAPFSNQWWFTDQYADGPRRMMDAFWAVPEWAPAHESHLLGSISPVTKITYGRGSVTYSTFDADSNDVLRLDFTPTAVRVGGRTIASVPSPLQREGYTFDEKTGVLRIHHTTSRDVDVQGSGGNIPPSLVTFDAPHEPAGTALNGQYPSGAIDWGASQWRIATPLGKFGTFNAALTDANATRAEFHFYAPRIFLGFDIYNDADRDTTLTVMPSSGEELTITMKAKELKHVRLDASVASASVAFEFEPGAAGSLRFDNVAYAHP
jgi:hypothetical protein